MWYASFGSNILLERFECYLRGGRIDGMVRDMPGSRDPTPPLASTFWVDVPHRLFFAHSSPTWAGGGVAFMDVDTLVDPTMATAFRLYRVTLEQFNDVLAQENGMVRRVTRGVASSPSTTRTGWRVNGQSCRRTKTDPT